MLSRTAENLYWIGRYIERAETRARLLEVGARNALLPNTGGGYRNEWDAILAASGTADNFDEKYGDAVQRNVESHMFFDEDNPNSVASCLSQARENGRIVRTALTSPMWDGLNTAFQEIREMQRTERSQLPLSDLIDWTMRTSMLLRGAIVSLQLRNDGYHFMQMGLDIERAVSTARLLDVKYYVLLPEVSYVGTGLDNYQWVTLLRAMSSYRAFSWAYGGELSARKIADFLILNRQCPRSLLTCVASVMQHLDGLSRMPGGRTEAQRAAGHMLAELAEADIQEVFDEGLHEFLTRFIKQIGVLSNAIHSSYLTGRAA